MFTILSEFLQKKHITLFSALPLSDCKVVKPYLLERAGILEGTVVIMAIPYYTEACSSPSRNLSAYAVSRDYHLFFRALYGELLPLLSAHAPNARFAAFADHSPIDEIHAASIAGLGVIGKNGLLLTEEYGSYVFLGEIVTDLLLEAHTHTVRLCADCGACQAACPAMQKGLPCLSALTQKKGALSKAELDAILDLGSVWGCDVCQQVCPYNKRALQCGSITSPIPFFREGTIPHLTSEILEGMSEEEFASRAYSWRGKETILRNLRVAEKGEI